MLFSLEMLIKENKPICVRSDKTVQEALQIMVEKDFTQLPVVDQQDNLTILAHSSSNEREKIERYSSHISGH